MDEIAAAEKDSAQVTDQTSESEKESTSKTPVTHTADTEKKAVSDALALQGRKHKEALDPIIQERDTFKSQAEQAVKAAQEATDTLEETRQHISNLESDIEALEEDEADPNKLGRLRKELRDAKGNVRQEVKDERDAVAELRRTTEAEREEWAGTVAEAQAFKFDGEVAKIVDEYEGDVTANFTKLKEACEKAGIKTKEGAEAIAETFMTKKVEEPDVLDDSSVTKGGQEDLNNLSSKELRGQAYKPKKR